MTFNDDDRIFFMIITSFKKDFEDIMKESLKYKINITKELMEKTYGEVSIEEIKNPNKKPFNTMTIVLGYYDKTKGIYNWAPSTKKLVYEMILKYIDIFGTTKTIDKLFTDAVKISYEDHYVIPYLVGCVYKLNVIRFITEMPNGDELYFYMLVDLKIKNNFDPKKFVSDFGLYRLLSATNNKKTSKQKVNKNGKKSKR